MQLQPTERFQHVVNASAVVPNRVRWKGLPTDHPTRRWLEEHVGGQEMEWGLMTYLDGTRVGKFGIGFNAKLNALLFEQYLATLTS